MEKTKEIFQKEVLPNIITMLLWLIILWIIFWIQYFIDFNKKDCTQSDIYNIWEYSQCTPEWKMSRIITQNSQYSCKSPWKVVKPEESVSCEYVPQCTEANWKAWEWWICSASWTQDRVIEKIGKCEWGFILNQTQVCSTKTTYLFKKWIKEHTTIIEEEKYSIKNHNNLEISPSWKFKSIRLNIIWDISPVKINEYFYIFYWLDLVNAIPKVIWTSRIKSNRLDLSDIWVFQWTNTPKAININLNSLKLANEWNNLWSTINWKSFDLINSSSGKILKMSLYMADWQSMTTSDMSKRIFWTITNAWLEYECEENSSCLIKRIPEIN